MAGMVDPDFDHSNCAQARYMARQGGYNKSNTRAYDKDVRKSGNGQKLWSELNTGRDFSGEPGIRATRKSLKLTGNSCWNSHNLHFR